MQQHQHHAQFASLHPQVPWSFAYEMRNVLAHAYFKVDDGLVWQTIQGDLPQLRAAIQALLGKP